MNKMNIKNALAKVGVSDERQNEFFAAFKGKSVENIDNCEIAEVLEKLGVTGGQALLDFYAALKEPQIMEQELDLDELEAVAGGNACDDEDADKDNCIQQLRRPLYSDPYGRVINCAATVETSLGCNNWIDSTCSLNDGCSEHAVIYIDYNGYKAHRSSGHF